MNVEQARSAVHEAEHRGAGGIACPPECGLRVHRHDTTPRSSPSTPAAQSSESDGDKQGPGAAASTLRRPRILRTRPGQPTDGKCEQDLADRHHTLLVSTLALRAPPAPVTPAHPVPAPRLPCASHCLYRGPKRSVYVKRVGVGLTHSTRRKRSSCVGAPLCGELARHSARYPVQPTRLQSRCASRRSIGIALLRSDLEC